MTSRNPLRRVARELRTLAFVLGQRRRHDRLVLERVAGFPVVVLPQVFNPSLFVTGALLARAVAAEPLPAGATVLDMGTGSGVGAVAAARRGVRVVAVDVNPHAVRCARLNALLNAVEDRVEVRHGDLFAPLDGERFELVAFNPPYFRGVPRSPLDRAWRSPDVAERFAAGLADHLAPRGIVLLLLSTDGDADGFLDALRAAGFSAEPALRRDLLSEVVTVFRLRRRVA